MNKPYTATPAGKVIKEKNTMKKKNTPGKSQRTRTVHVCAFSILLKLTSFQIYPVVWDQSKILSSKEPTELQMESYFHI